MRAALAHLSSGGDAPDIAGRKRAVGIGISAAAVGVFTALASNGGRFEGSSTTMLLVAAAAAVLGVVFAAIRIARRS